MDFEQISQKMKKLQKLDQKNFEVHQKFNDAILQLVQAKLSTKALHFLEPQFYKEQSAKTTATIHQNNQVQLQLGELPEFYGLAEHKVNVLKAQKLHELFQSVLVEYIAYSNYLKKIINKS